MALKTKLMQDYKMLRVKITRKLLLAWETNRIARLVTDKIIIFP